MSEHDDSQQRQLNIHMDPDVMAGVYSNFANISFSDYEFTLTFARIDHEVEEGDVPGVVVARVNMSTRFMHELLEAMNDAYSKWTSREGIRNLPETTGGGEDSVTRRVFALLPGLGHRDPLHEGRVGIRGRGTPRSAGSAVARLVSENFSNRPWAEAGSRVASSAIQSASASTWRETTFCAGVNAIWSRSEHEEPVGQDARVAEAPTPSSDLGKRKGEREAEQGNPANALPEMTARHVAELVGDDEADLAAAEATVEQGVEEHNSRRRAEAGDERVRLGREVAHVLHVHRRAGDSLAPLERAHVLAQGRALRRVDRERQQVRGDEQRERDEPDEDRCHREPPVPREAPREAPSRSRSGASRRRTVPPSSAQGSSSQAIQGPCARSWRCSHQRSGDREREVRGPDDREHDHPDDHPGADRPQPRVPSEARSTPDEDEQGDDRRDERKHEVDSHEPFVALGARELGRAEVVVRIEARKVEIARNLRAPEERCGH